MLQAPAPVPRTRILARIVIAVLAFLAYLPALAGGYVYDDHRFVEENTALDSFTPMLYFTDPSTVAEESWEGIYRPLRTLDFAIDRAIAGNTPFFPHLRNLLYHLAGALLVYGLIRRLLDSDAAAFYGALAFALHPVHTESVAWITSRADAMVLVAFLGALILHLDGRRRLAAGVLVLALFSKEAAVVFPGAVLLADRLRGERIRLGWTAIYGGLCAGYTVFWFFFLGGGEMAGFGHLDSWWGGSYGANLLTMSRGFLYYLSELLFPVALVIDYHVPATPALDAGSAIGIVAVVAIGIASFFAGPRARFAFLWFFVLLLPVSNLLRPIGIPTAERFLYLPSIGIAVWAAPYLARTRLTVAVLACFFALTAVRCLDWQTDEKLFASAARVTETPRSLGHLADAALGRAHEELDAAREAGPVRGREHEARARKYARETIRHADALVALHRDQIRLPVGRIGAAALSQKANALVILGDYEAALAAADASILAYPELPYSWFNAALALEKLGRYAEAARNCEKAMELGYEDSDLTPIIRDLRRMAGTRR